MGLLVALYLALGIQFGTTVIEVKNENGTTPKHEITTKDNRPGDGEGW